MLSDDDVERFIEEGFVRIDGAFPRALAAQARAILWRETGCDPEDPATWTRPVIRLDLHGEAPFRQAANTPLLHAALDRLVGQGRWLPRVNLGTFPARFPSSEDAGDTGWHIDVSFRTERDDPNEYLGRRATVTSKDRALVMLFLFSDVGEADAPTHVRAGSHAEVARVLAPAGEDGMTLRELATNGHSRNL
jgi:hypothetical protein